MKLSALCFVLLCVVAVVMAFPAKEERTKRSPHHSKIKVKYVERGPFGIRKHKLRLKSYGYGGGLGGYAGGYGYGGLGSYGWPRAASSSAFATSFSSPIGSFAAAGASAGR